MPQKRKVSDETIVKIAGDVASGKKSVARAMMENGYAETTAMHQSHALTRSPVYIAAFEKMRAALRDRNVNEKRIAKTIDEGMSADRAIGVDAGGTGSKKDKIITAPDWNAREKFTRLACKLLGYDVEVSDPGGRGDVNILSLIFEASKDRGLPPDQT